MAYMAFIKDIEPVRIPLEGGGIGRVIFSGSAPTADDFEMLIQVLTIQKRRMNPSDEGTEGLAANRPHSSEGGLS